MLNSGNLFNQTQTLTLEAIRDIRPQEPLTINYGAEKSDSRVALDHGVVDLKNLQVSS